MSPRSRGRARRTLLLIAAAVVAPIALSYAFYYFAPREAATNYGELLPTTIAPALDATRSDGQPLRIDAPSGLWNVVIVAEAACDAVCVRQLYATRQARTIQGRERERVQRIWLVTDAAAPSPALLAEHPDVVIARTTSAQAARLPRGARAIHLIDPIANLVLAWPSDPDIKAMAGDIARVLKASRIG
jgi:hypothetical protein